MGKGKSSVVKNNCIQGVVVRGTTCCREVDKSSDTYYEVPDGVGRTYEEVVEGPDVRDGQKHLRNQVITGKNDEMAKLQEGAWAMDQAGNERGKDRRSNVEIRDGATIKVNILKF